MARSFCRAYLATALLCGWVAGCTKPMTTKQVKPPPPDPLLMSKKPIEGKPYDSNQDQTAHFDPTPPPPPTRRPWPADRQLVAPGWQRDPISGVHIGFQPVETGGQARPITGTTTSGQP